MTSDQHIHKLLPVAQKHANYYGVDWMICTLDECDETAWHVRPLSYANGPEFEAFDGRIEVVVQPGRQVIGPVPEGGCYLYL